MHSICACKMASSDRGFAKENKTNYSGTQHTLLGTTNLQSAPVIWAFSIWPVVHSCIHSCDNNGSSTSKWLDSGLGAGIANTNQQQQAEPLPWESVGDTLLHSKRFISFIVYFTSFHRVSLRHAWGPWNQEEKSLIVQNLNSKRGDGS